MLSKLCLLLVALWMLHPRTAAGQYGRNSPTPIRPTASPLPSASPLPVATSTPRPTATPVPPGEVRVKVIVTGADGKALPAADAVAWFPGLRGPAPAAAPRMASRDKRFEPRVLAVPQGSAVTFPNYDRIFHNVFSLS